MQPFNIHIAEHNKKDMINTIIKNLRAYNESIMGTYEAKEGVGAF